MYKVAYILFNVAVISILYATQSSILFREDILHRPIEVDGGVEFVVWGSVLLSWLAYALLQGSDPGYIHPSMRIGGAPSSAAAAEHVVIDLVPEALPPLQPAAGQDAHARSGDGRPSEEARARAEPANDFVELLRRDEGDFDPSQSGEFSEAAVQAREGVRPCKWCHAQQLARAKHCRDCNKCVALYDHHCHWIGTCIGERNRARFWWYLTAQWIALAVAIGILNTGFVWRRGMSDWVWQNSLTLAALVVLWGLQVFVFGLWVFHSWLACTNTTTYELSSGSKRLWYLAGSEPQDCDLPYSRGLCTNLRLFCCELETGGLCCGLLRRAKTGGGQPWQPTAWVYPGRVERDGSDWTANLWSNQYWSCC